MTAPESGALPAEQTSKGFLAALFDFEFKTFIALKFIKVIYIIAIALVGLGGVVVFFTALANNQIGAALAALVFMFFYLVGIRVWLEVIALLFRIGEDTSAIRGHFTSSG